MCRDKNIYLRSSPFMRVMLLNRNNKTKILIPLISLVDKSEGSGDLLVRSKGSRVCADLDLDLSGKEPSPSGLRFPGKNNAYIQTEIRLHLYATVGSLRHSSPN